MKQRVAIARAMVMDPAVLLMDEPFAALDAQTRTLLHAQLQELWIQTKKTILFVTHSVGEAVRLADRIIVLSAYPGRIRREIRVELSHPRDFDSPQISELVRLVRTEIEEEVNRVNREMAGDEWKPAASAHLGDGFVDLGGSI
jgi:NitT/TauT family transport system ATP-binding protein